jgi:hypoxanthine phosphoribosyltransferase
MLIGTKEHLSWQAFGGMLHELERMIAPVHEKVPFDRVVGISRGGLPLAVAISHTLKLPFTPVEIKSYKEDNTRGNISCETPVEVLHRCRGHILLVDDLADSGKTSDFLMSHLRELTNAEFTLATLYYKPTSIVRPDLFVAETDKWIIFPWESA